jgi:hypothetical protein
LHCGGFVKQPCLRIIKNNGDTFQREDETEIILAQYIVENDGTIEEFEKTGFFVFNHAIILDRYFRNTPNHLFKSEKMGNQWRKQHNFNKYCALSVKYFNGS